MPTLEDREAAQLPKAWPDEGQEDVERFIESNGLNERAADALRHMAPRSKAFEKGLFSRF